MLSNAYFLAKFRFDTAENEPAKKLQNFANFPNSLTLTPGKPRVAPEVEAPDACRVSAEALWTGEEPNGPVPPLNPRLNNIEYYNID